MVHQKINVFSFYCMMIVVSEVMLLSSIKQIY